MKRIERLLCECVCPRFSLFVCSSETLDAIAQVFPLKGMGCILKKGPSDGARKEGIT